MLTSYKRRPHGHYGYRRLRGDVRAVPPDGPAGVVQTGRGVGVRFRDGLGPLSSLDPGSGAECLRVVLDGRFGRDDEPPFRHGCDPAGLSVPSGDYRPGGGDARSDVPRTILAWVGCWGGVERAHRRRLLARGANPLAHTYGGHRGDPQ